MIWNKTRTPKADWKVEKVFAYFPTEVDNNIVVWMQSYWRLVYCVGRRTMVCWKWLNESVARSALKTLVGDK